MSLLPLKPYLHLQDGYRFRARNAPDAPAYFYQNRSVYRLKGVVMELVGVLHDKAKPGYGTVSFHPTAPVAAFNDGNDVLKLGDFEGNYLWEGIDHCVSSLISSDGRHVWAVSRINRNALRVCLYECETGRELAALDLPDELCESSAILSDIPHSLSVTLELAAGQDGIMVYRLDWTGDKIEAGELFPGKSYTAPAWRPDGGAFLTLENDDNTLAWFTCSPVTLVCLEPERQFETEEDWDNANGHYHLCLPGDLCIVQTVNNRYHLLNPASMERVTELVVTGFASRPTGKVFENLSDDRAMYCELECLERLGGLVVAYTWRGEGAKQDLLIFREKDLSAALSGC